MTKPLYQKIKTHILEKIQSGAWKKDDRVPSENELVNTFGVSRMTANRALKELTEMGVLIRVSGVGTFVAPPRSRSEFLTIRDIAEELAERGHQHTVKVLAQEKVENTDKLLAAFETTPDEEIIHAKLLHFQDNVPILLEDRYVNAKLAPDFLFIDLTKTSSFQYLMNTAPISRAQHTVRAISPDKETRKLLNLLPNEPGLLLHRRTWSKDRIVSIANLTHAGSRYEITGIFTPK